MNIPNLKHYQSYKHKKAQKKHIKKVPQVEFEKGDPDFVDERKKPDKQEEEEKSFFSSLFEPED